MNTLNIIAPINQLGYGTASIGILDGLNKLNSNVSLFPINEFNMECHPKYTSIINKFLQNSLSFDNLAACIRIFHQFNLNLFVGKGEHIGFPFFELDKFTDLEKHHISNTDRIFVASNWAKSIILQETNQKNVSVIPLGVDREIFFDTPIPKNKQTVFITVGKFEHRKSHGEIVESFCRAFKDGDNVTLWMMCDNPVTPSEDIKWKTKIKSYPLSHKIRFIPRQSTQDGVANILRSAHFGVFPARAEGWNMELLEMLSCGRQCITTNYSAHTQFCTKQNSVLIDVKETEPAYDGVYFHGGGNWAKIDNNMINEIVDNMRLLYEKHQAGEDIYNYAGVETAKNLSWENTARTIMESI